MVDDELPQRVKDAAARKADAAGGKEWAEKVEQRAKDVLDD